MRREAKWKEGKKRRRKSDRRLIKAGDVKDEGKRKELRSTEENR